jgi:hypothetical protein
MIRRISTRVVISATLLMVLAFIMSGCGIGSGPYAHGDHHSKYRYGKNAYHYEDVTDGHEHR